MNVSKEKQLCGWYMVKSLSTVTINVIINVIINVKMGVWSQSPEQGCVKRLELCQLVHRKLMAMEMVWAYYLVWKII